MGRIHHPFPIDLTLANKSFPIMKAAAKNLEPIPQLYEEISLFVWEHFLSLFTNPDIPPPSHNRKAWEALMEIRDKVEARDMARSFQYLRENNESIAAALAALGAILNR